MCGKTVAAVGPRASVAGTRLVFALGSTALLALAGCATPFGSEDVRQGLEKRLAADVHHELRTFDDEREELQTSRLPSPVAAELAERKDELESMSPSTAANPTPFTLGPDLEGHDQKELAVGLSSVIASVVANNLPVRRARLQPSINREQLIVAESVFDFALFANFDWNYLDQPGAVPIVFGTPIGAPVTKNESFAFGTGVRKQFRSGGSFFVQTEAGYFDNRTTGIDFAPDPSYTAVQRLGFTQPLLRNFGEAVNTAQIRLASNARERSVEDLRAQLLALVADAEVDYWNLVLAWHEVEIRQWLVDVGMKVRDTLANRRDFDAKPAEYSDAVARVEQRRADVIRARRRVRLLSDQLKRRINDPEITVGSEVVLRPIDAFVDAPISYDVRAATFAAITNRPEVEIARLGISDASIGVDVADNGRLPILDLTGGIAFNGLDGNLGEAYKRSFQDSFIDYAIGLAFEYPIGNRGPEAEFRRSRLFHSQAMLAYRESVQLVVSDVKGALRDVVTNFELIEATYSFRIAQAENLRTLEAEEPLRGMTPEFLNLKFQRQEGLAEARRQELLALANFDQSIASLNRAMGTALRVHNIEIKVDEAEPAYVPLPIEGLEVTDDGAAVERAGDTSG